MAAAASLQTRGGVIVCMPCGIGLTVAVVVAPGLVVDGRPKPGPGPQLQLHEVRRDPYSTTRDKLVEADVRTVTRCSCTIAAWKTGFRPNSSPSSGRPSSPTPTSRCC